MPHHLPSISERHKRMLRKLLVTVVALAAAGIIIFGIRAYTASRAWHDRPPEDIAGWMTPRYVAMSQHVPPQVIEAVIAPDQDLMHHKMTLADLAAAQNVDLATLIVALETAIADFKDAPVD